MRRFFWALKTYGLTYELESNHTFTLKMFADFD